MPAGLSMALRAVEVVDEAENPPTKKASAQRAVTQEGVATTGKIRARLPSNDQSRSLGDGEGCAGGDRCAAPPSMAHRSRTITASTLAQPMFGQPEAMRSRPWAPEFPLRWGACGPKQPLACNLQQVGPPELTASPTRRVGNVVLVQ